MLLDYLVSDMKWLEQNVAVHNCDRIVPMHIVDLSQVAMFL